MEHEITHRPSYAQLELTLDQNESNRVETAAMVAHTDGINVETLVEYS